MKKILIVISLVIFTTVVISCGTEKKEKGNTPPPKEKIIKTEVAPKSQTSSGSAELSPQQKLGKRLFIMCEACHNVKEGEPHKVGPNLHGIFGREAGSLTDFKYSEAVMNSNITWSDETIREWLINPNDYIQGTNMVFVGLPKKRQQDALLAYLHHVAD